MYKQRLMIVVLLLMLMLVQPTILLPSLAEQPSTRDLLTNQSVGTGASIKSEEENIDSFDVSPASGRWNVTSDDLTDDLVTDSILRMTTINNETSGSSGFAMDRGMSKTDGKVEYRMAASGGGNQTEFFRDQVGDKCDFEEGDVEGLSGLATNTASDGIYIGVVVADVADNILWPPFTEANTLFNNFSAEVYHTIRFRMMTNESELLLTLQAYILRGGGSRAIGTLDAPVSEDWTTYEITLSDDIDWIGAVSAFRFRFEETDGLFEGDEGIFIDWIELIGDLDYATFVEGEIEDTWDWEVDNSTESWIGLVNMNVSEGFLRGRTDAAVADGLDSPVVNIDSSLFNIFIVRMNTSDITMDISVQADFGAGAVVVSNEQDLDSTSQTIYTFILSDDVDWSGTAIEMSLRFDEQDEDLDGNEIVFIDYFLLLGHWADSDSVIGLWDQDDLVPLLNVSSHFTSNNSHPTTSEKAYFTVELLDLDGEVSYSAISDNYTDVSDSWIQGKIQYDVLRSRLIVTINWDNLTRIEKWTFPKDFTFVSGRIPALFSHSKSPSIFTSTFCQAISWQEMKLNYIRAPFTERKWTQSSNLPGVNWLQDRWDIAYVQDNILDSSAWDLIVPLLDSFSGTISMSFSDTDGIDDGDDVKAGIFLMGIDANDGDKHHILGIEIEQIRIDNGGLHWKTRITPFVDGAGAAVEITDNVAFPLDEEPRVSFSFSLSEDRSIASMKVRIWSDFDDEEGYIDVVREVAVSSNVDDPSQEFIIRTDYFANFDHDIEWTALVEDFGFVEKDIFTEFVAAIVEPLGNFFQQIFVGLFRFVAGIFKVVGDLITLSITTMQTALTAAINQIQGWLTTLGTTINTSINQISGWLTALGTTISTAIDQIDGWLTTLGTTISEAIAAIAADIWDAFGVAAAGIMDDIITALTGLASDVADFIDGIIQFLIPLLLAIAADLADLFVGILDALITIGGDILSGIMNFIAGVVFFIWEALGLPDILAIAEMFLGTFVEIVNGLPAYFTDLTTLLTTFTYLILGFYWFWAVFLGFASKGFDIFAGFGEMVNRFLTVYNFNTAVGTIPIPIALIFWPMTYFLILPAGSVFTPW